MLNTELLDDFAQEVGTLKTELNYVVNNLGENIDQPQQFAKFAQVIDRIYGTAATFGFKELAAYCGMLKTTCQECGKTPNKRAYPKVLTMLKTCMENLDTLMKGIHDPEINKKLSHTLHLENQKSKKLYEEFFQYTKK